MKDANINFNVKLNDENVPIEIRWSATDASHGEEKDVKAIMISMWDSEKKESLGIDLWTENTQIGEMNNFFCDAFVRMSETYKTATKDEEIANMILQFAKDFAKKVVKEEVRKQKKSP